MQRVRISRQSPLRVLIYGKAGAGKTTLAGTAGLDPRSSPVLWLDCGGNPISLAKLRKPAITVMRITAVAELANVYNWLAAGQPAKDYFALENRLTPPYKTVVFDGITHVQRLSFDAILGTENIAPGLTPPVPAWPHYRSSLAQMIVIASKFYTLPLHVIMTALDHPDQRQLDPTDPKTAFIYHEPMLQGQSVDELPGWALSVGRIALAASYIDRIVREVKAEAHQPIIQFVPTRYVDAKDQLGLGDYIANPTVKRFLDTIEANAAQADDITDDSGESL
jgi:AAA domain-containing protein